ncbi:cysteine desulfurase family protein [Leucobacter triazinivorans]|uniref:cysteine desulfurase n=1 Tax=Leucobacter triazinivorans TaxID=1784719 RepID=A0A4P6KDQ5_9MICO|nr:cysteine desulfurase family protein [Leucobacter triazinivorans]QBE48210.1 cysteine desulfurase [Leucobacter triazinivorans]
MSTTEPTRAPHAPRYLDAAATAPLRAEARAALIDALDAGAANPSSVHSAGHRARMIVDEARARVAAGLGARAGELIFTSGGTEANNLAVIGLALANPRGRHVVTTAVEHPSVLESCRYLERVFGFELTVLDVDGTGRVSAEALAAVLRPDTTLVSIGLANGEVGTVQPVPELAAVARLRGALVHTDAVQAAPSLPVSFGSADRASGPDATIAGDGWPGPGVDAMTVASHKFGGPQGAGALLLRGHLRLEPLLHGGGQERGARSGTENVAAIAGFGAAVRACAADVGSRALELMRSRDAFVELVLAEVPGARLTGHPSERLPGHASFVIEGVSGESLLVALDAAGFAVSSGSACAAGKDEPSPTLLALGLSPEIAQTAIRFTFPAPLSETDLARVVAVLRLEASAAGAARPRRM